MINNISFSGQRIIGSSTIVQHTSVSEDVKDLSEILKSLKNTNADKISCDRNAGFFVPVIKTDMYIVIMPQSKSLADVPSICIRDLKNKITRAFYANSENHDVRTLFEECVDFVRIHIYRAVK